MVPVTGDSHALVDRRFAGDSLFGPRHGDRKMNKIRNVLMTAVSALAALAHGGAVARGTSHDPTADPSPGGVAQRAETIKVSQRAQEQIGVQSAPRVNVPKTAGPKIVNPGVTHGGATVVFSERGTVPVFRETDSSSFTEKIPVFNDSKGNNPKIDSGVNVQRTFDRNQAQKQIQQKGQIRPE